MIVVTGASKGLGAAICERLHARGDKVFGIARDTGNLNFDGVNCDVGDYAAVKAAMRLVKKTSEPIEAVINAAGIASMNLAVTTDQDTTTRLIRTNLMGTIFVCQLFAPMMIRRRTGCFINFSTVAVALALKGESVYAASKSGVEAFSRAFAREMADFDVRVNCIAPGPIKTDLLRGITDAQIDKIVSQQIVPKQYEKSDVCDLVELLLSPKANALSGQVLNVGGV